MNERWRWALAGFVAAVDLVLLVAILWPEPGPTFHAVTMSPTGWRMYYGAPGDSATTMLLRVPSDTAQTVVYRLPLPRAGPFRLVR